MAIIDKYIKPISLLGVFWAAFFLPLKTSLSNIGLIVLVVMTIISFITYGMDRSRLKKPQVYYSLPWILLFPILVGMLYSPWKNEAVKELILSIFLLLLPLLFFRKDKGEINLYKYAGLGLIFGVAVNTVFLLSINFYEFFISDYPFRALFNAWFTGERFTEPLGEDMHTLYIGTYYVLALAFLAFEKNKIPKLCKVVLALLILMAIGFLNSRIIYLSTALLGLLFAMDKLSWRVFALSITGLLVTLAMTFSFFQKTFIYNKLVKRTVWDLSENIGTNTIGVTADSRMARWLVALELIEEKPIIGHGTGTEDRLLDQKYREYNMKNSMEQGYNSHNQFLGYLIKFGVFGVLFLVIYFAANFYLAIKHKELVYLSYLLMLGSVFLIENYLDRNMGISLVALFGTLFLLRNSGKNQDIKD